MINVQVIHLVRPLRCNNWVWFCCLQEMEVQSPPGTTVGWIKQECSFIYPRFSIQNADGETILTIKGPCWTCKWCDVEFEVPEFCCAYSVSALNLLYSLVHPRPHHSQRVIVVVWFVIPRLCRCVARYTVVFWLYLGYAHA